MEDFPPTIPPELQRRPSFAVFPESIRDDDFASGAYDVEDRERMTLGRLAGFVLILGALPFAVVALVVCRFFK
jgi:hypothetical protein